MTKNTFNHSIVITSRNNLVKFLFDYNLTSFSGKIYNDHDNQVIGKISENNNCFIIIWDKE